MKQVHSVDDKYYIRESLALRLRSNWLAKHPADGSESNGIGGYIDEGLTDLNWLCNLNAKEILKPSLPAPAKPQHVVDHRHTVRKPTLSYATLIRRALEDSSEKKLTLAGIYNWVMENFPYYKTTSDMSWQNSIRHNLSMNKCFQKVPRGLGEVGKGGFWCYVPEGQNRNTGHKRSRYYAADPATPPSLKRRKSEEEVYNAAASILPQEDTMGFGAVFSRRSPIKIEPEAHAIHHMPSLEDGRSQKSAWSRVSQDIEVAGMQLTADDIINDEDPLAEPIMELSSDQPDSDGAEAFADFLHSNFNPDPYEDTNAAMDVTGDSSRQIHGKNFTMSDPLDFSHFNFNNERVGKSFMDTELLDFSSSSSQDKENDGYFANGPVEFSYKAVGSNYVDSLAVKSTNELEEALAFFDY